MSSGGATTDCDPIWVITKYRDVPLHEFKSQLLVEETEVEKA